MAAATRRVGRLASQINPAAAPAAEALAEERFDVIVVGAGVVGSAIASTLGRQRRRVLVVERDLRTPDRIVGELLQPGGVRLLRELGLDGCLEGIDAPIVHGYVIFYKGEPVPLPYPSVDPSERTIGRSFHHGAFVDSLRRAAAAEPSVELRQGTVTKLVEVDNVVTGVEYKVQGRTQRARAPLTIVCDGHFSRFRAGLTTAKSTHASHFVGIVVEDCQLPSPNHGHVIICDPSPVLSYPIGTRDTRILIDVPNPLPKQANGELEQYIRNHVAPQLPEPIREALLRTLPNAKLRAMPNAYLPAKSIVKPGVLLVGDALNMRHPLTGGGMSVGFSDCVLIRDLLADVDINDVHAVHRALSRFPTLRKPLSSTVNILANALYSLFAAQNDKDHLPIMREACMEYLALGGEPTNGPMLLLSILRPEPYLLVSHFFAVAAYGMQKIMSKSDITIPQRFQLASGVLLAATRIIKPLIDDNGVTVLSKLPTPGFLRLPSAAAAAYDEREDN